MSDRNKAHTILVRETLILVGKEAHHISRVWENQTGVAYRENSLKERQYIAYGLVGSADIFCLIKDGPLLGLECKTGTGHQYAQQLNFEKMMISMGHRYLVVRSPGQALEYVLEEAAASEARRRFLASSGFTFPH